MWHLNWAAVGSVFTLVLSGILTYVAYQQYVINQRQYRLALFEKRMAVFNSTMEMIASVVKSANPTLPECFQFIQDTRNHEFLFGPDVGEFINEVYKKATALRAHIMTAGAAQQTPIMQWFVDQMGEARKMFLPYLDFRMP